jgi:hypothetical protein
MPVTAMTTSTERGVSTDDRSGPDDSDAAPEDTPRWVKVFGSILIAVIVLFLLLMLIGGPGQHGPRRHLEGATSPANSTMACDNVPGCPAARDERGA